MSRSRTERADDGFSLVEVVAAIGIVVVVMVAVLPQMVNGIRAGSYARVSTQGKTMITSELELMRNLPFQVQPNAGEYVDLFDRYFQDLIPPTGGPGCRDGDLWTPPPSEASGFVSASGERCSYEPSGPFYRIVRRADGPDIKGMKPDPDLEDLVVVVDTQFLKPALDAQGHPQVAEPLAGYNTKVVGKDTPASGLVGITVTVMADQPSRQRPLTTYSQIARSYQTTTRVRAISDSMALEAQTMLPGPSEREGNVVAVSGGLAHLEASLVTASRVDVAAAATTATAASGENAGTTRTSFSAPPDGPATWSPKDAGGLTPAGCALACWGGGDYSGNWTPTTVSGLPGIGSPTNPLEVALKAPSASEGDALRMGSGTNPLFRPELGLANPILKLRSSDFTYGVTSSCTVSDSGSGLRLSGGGWAYTTDTGVDACSTARTADVAILPRAGTGEPLVKVRLRAAAARCRVSGGAPSADLDFLADVSYWDGTSYASLGAFAEDGSNQLPNPDTLLVGTTPLSRWIESWSIARTGAGITRQTTARSARVDVPAVVSILTVPLRNGINPNGTPRLDETEQPAKDPLSTLAVTVGSVSCSAEDRR